MTFADLAGDTWRRAPRLDRTVLALALGLVLLTLADADQLPASATFTTTALVDIAPFIALSVAFAAYARASGLDNQIARAFSGRRIGLAVIASALIGALSPFCSCGVVPIIAGFLAAGVPLAPVMAFWLASPLMDPEMFILMVPVFGLSFTLAKLAGAVLVGLAGGFAALELTRRGYMDDVLRGAAARGCTAGCAPSRSPDAPVVAWAFWLDAGRRARFAASARDTGLFLGKWLALAFFLESLMVAYVPAEAIGTLVGSQTPAAIPLAVAAGIPAYLNGYAAIPTVSGLMELGMTAPAALGFMLAGGVTSIPAAMAVWPLVRARVFALYLTTGWAGALAAAWALSLA